VCFKNGKSTSALPNVARVRSWLAIPSSANSGGKKAAFNHAASNHTAFNDAGGVISLFDGQGVKIHGVSYTTPDYSLVDCSTVF
jgi:hypothetical protein